MSTQTSQERDEERQRIEEQQDGRCFMCESEFSGYTAYLAPHPIRQGVKVAICGICREAYFPRLAPGEKWAHEDQQEHEARLRAKWRRDWGGA